MSSKVLVFESDPAFAAELRKELGQLGCATTVVDDGNLGLQQASAEKPDLILLSIELPRMNGFSVCNKLKKDPALKDVPLIIMSSESTDETFEQHKKLRTRAEDYVHKPIAFGELLGRIQSFVKLSGSAPASDADGAIMIDDEIEVSSDYVLEDDDEPTGESPSARPRPPSVKPPAEDDSDVDEFAESAFGRLTSPKLATVEPLASATNGAAASVRPPPAALDSAELEKVRADLDKTRAELDRVRAAFEKSRAEAQAAQESVAAVGRDLEEARRETDKLRLEAGDAAQLAREVEQLKAKVAAGGKGPGISSREFLDLREALNKKDKEILSLREQLSKKDREIVESQDRALGFERGKADLDERLLVLERELAESKERAEAVTTERDTLRRTGDDLKSRLEKTRIDAEEQERLVAELRSTLADERAASEAKHAAAQAEHAEKVTALENERDARIAALEARATREQTGREEAEKQLAELRERLAVESSRAEKAHGKWQADRQSLDRAKDALAVALAQIEEAEARPID
jgi:CheY-like chemotaxis protein